MRRTATSIKSRSRQGAWARSAALAALSRRDAGTELGPHSIHIQRIGVQIPAEMVDYGMTKTAQIAVARGIAESVAGTGVMVNSILAGPT